MTSIILRGVAYIILAAGIAQLLMLEALRFPMHQRFYELGMVEIAQSLMLATAVLCLAWKAWRDPVNRTLALCMALVFAILLVRENDQILELWLPHGIWKWPAGLLALLLLGITVRNGEQLKAQFIRFSQGAAFSVFLAGGATLVFSRLFGRGSFWEAVMDDEYLRVVKNAAEEGTELFALGILLMGVIEWVVRRQEGPDDKL